MVKPNTGIATASIVWVTSYIFFLLSLVNNFSASHDSISYLDHIVTGEHLFHQHHLLYNFSAHYWLKLWAAVLPQVPAHYIVEAFTAFWGSSALAVCFLFFSNRFSVPQYLALAGVGAIALSFGFWFYSVNVEVYSAPLFFLLLSLYIITRKERRHTDVFSVALLHAMAILFHQVNILFIPIVLAWLMSDRKMPGFAPRLLLYVAVLIISVGGVYLIIGWGIEGKRNIADFTEWLLGYTSGHGYWQPLSTSTPLQVLAGFGRTFVGAHFIFQLPVVENFLQQSFGSHHLTDEVFLLKKMPPTAAVALSGLSAAIGLFLLVMIVRFIGAYKKMSLHRRVLMPLLLTMAVYSVFFFFWEPEVVEFWILQMVITWLLLVGMLPVVRFPFRINNTVGMVTLCVLLFVVNYFGSIKWLTDIDNDWYFAEVKKIQPSGNDLVIVEDEWILKDYVRYYTDAKVIATDESAHTRAEIGRIVKEISSSGSRVYLYRNAHAADGTSRWHIIQSY